MEKQNKKPLQKSDAHTISELHEICTIKSGINPFGWYHAEDIISAIEYLKDILGNECDYEVNDAFQIGGNEDALPTKVGSFQKQKENGKKTKYG